MPILYRSLTIDRMWVLLEGHAPFAAIVSQARRVKDTSEGWLKSLMLRSVGDFPHVQIQMGDNFGGAGIPVTDFASERTDYGDLAGDYWLEERTSDFKLSFIYETPNFDKQDTLEMTAIEAFEAAGRDLGWEYTSSVFPIKTWGPWRGRRSGTAIINEIERPTTQIIIPVKYEFTGTQLKP